MDFCLHFSYSCKDSLTFSALVGFFSVFLDFCLHFSYSCKDFLTFSALSHKLLSLVFETQWRESIDIISWVNFFRRSLFSHQDSSTLSIVSHKVLYSFVQHIVAFVLPQIHKKSFGFRYFIAQTNHFDFLTSLHKHQYRLLLHLLSSSITFPIFFRFLPLESLDQIISFLLVSGDTFNYSGSTCGVQNSSNWLSVILSLHEAAPTQTICGPQHQGRRLRLLSSSRRLHLQLPLIFLSRNQ